MISVICSTYNSAKWIDGYLKSLENQTYAGFEVIFVDANSDDGSRETIEHWIENGEFYNFVPKLIKCEDKVSIYEAWNIGIQEARYPWVMNYNTDDRIYDGALSTYVRSIRENIDADVIYSPCIVVTNEQHTEIAGMYNWPNYSHDELLKQCLCGPFPLLRKETILEHGGFNPEYTISGDYEMWCRLSKADKKFVKIHDLIGSYFYNPTGMSTNPQHTKEHLEQDRKIRSTYV